MAGPPYSIGEKQLSPAVLASFPWPQLSWILWTGPVDPSLFRALACPALEPIPAEAGSPTTCSASHPRGRLSKTPSQSPGLGQLPGPCRAPQAPSPPISVVPGNCQAPVQVRLTPHPAPSSPGNGTLLLNTAWSPGACFPWAGLQVMCPRHSPPPIAWHLLPHPCPHGAHR